MTAVAKSDQYAQFAVERWKDLLEGINNPLARKNTAIILENQSRYFGRLEEETRTTNVGSYIKNVFPLIRRVFPSLVANDIASIQPMSGPVGAVFYFEVKYGTTKGKITAGQNLVQNFDPYYTSERVVGEVLATPSSPASSVSSALDFLPVRTSTVVVSAGNVSGVDNGSGTITGQGVSGSIDYLTGAIALSFTAPVTGAIVADYTYNSECNTNIPSVMLDVSMKPIVALTRKLRADICLEASDDLKALHGVAAEEELLNVMAQQLSLEIDREIIEDIRNASTLYPTQGGGFDVKAVPAGVSPVEHYLGIVHEISKASSKINDLTKRGPANWAITSGTVLSYIEHLSTVRGMRPVFSSAAADSSAPVEQPNEYAIFKAGKMNEKLTFYRDTYFPVVGADTGTGFGDILIGFKGQSWLDAGYVFAPYVPLQVTPSFTDPDSGTIKRLAYTRYGKAMLRPEFYSRVRVRNI